MAYDGPGIMAPMSFPIRDPRQRPKTVGRIENATGFMTRAGGGQGLGGLSSPAQIPTLGEGLRVERPESTKVATSSAKGLRKK